MLKQQLLGQLDSSEKFFNTSTSCLEESDSEFVPAKGCYSTAQQVAHAAQAIEWFIAGAFREQGFSTNFEEMHQEILGVTSLSAARDWMKRAYESARIIVNEKSEEEWSAPLPEGPIMGGLPRLSVIAGIEEHTAHHRGALTVYARLQGKVPTMPYEEAEKA